MNHTEQSTPAPGRGNALSGTAQPTTEDIDDLGLFAALCEVWACYPGTPPRERERLALRAARYRDLQLAATAELTLAERVCR